MSKKLVKNKKKLYGQDIVALWGFLVQKFYENGWEAKTQISLRMKSELKEFSYSYLQDLMKGVKVKFGKRSDKEVFSTFVKPKIK